MFIHFLLIMSKLNMLSHILHLLSINGVFEIILWLDGILMKIYSHALLMIKISYFRSSTLLYGDNCWQLLYDKYLMQFYLLTFCTSVTQDVTMSASRKHIWWWPINTDIGITTFCAISCYWVGFWFYRFRLFNLKSFIYIHHLCWMCLVGIKT